MAELIKLGVLGKIMNIIKSMYSNVKSRVKHCNVLSDEFSCRMGVRQGDCLSPFLFSMFVNDLESEFEINGMEGIDIGMIKLFILLYADDIVIFAESEHGMQTGLNILSQYCDKWKLKVNTAKTKILIFRKGGMLPRHLEFHYGNTVIE